MSIRNGARMGNSITQWKKKNPLSTLFARIVSGVGGFAGGAMLVICCLGLIAGSAMKNGPDFGAMVGLGVGGMAIDIGSHWIAVQIDKKAMKSRDQS